MPPNSSVTSPYFTCVCLKDSNALYTLWFSGTNCAGRSTWLVDGQYSFYDFLEYFDMEDLYAEHDYNTLSGLILEILERVPKTGEKLKWLDFEFEIVDMDGARIDKVLVKYLKNG